MRIVNWILIFILLASIAVASFWAGRKTQSKNVATTRETAKVPSPVMGNPRQQEEKEKKNLQKEEKLRPSTSTINRLSRDYGSKMPEDSKSRIKLFIEDGFSFAHYGMPRKDLIAAFGKPKQEKFLFHHEGNGDAYSRVTYDGFSAELVGEDKGADFVWAFTVSSPRFPVRWGLKVGAKADEVIKILGKPDYTDKDALSYELISDTLLHVEFSHHNNIISSITWGSVTD